MATGNSYFENTFLKVGKWLSRLYTKKVTQTLFVIFFPAILFAQIQKGSVVDKATKLPIPFASIGLIKNNVGTNCDAEGKFTISINRSGDDTLVVSCVGYITVKFSALNLPASMLFELVANSVTLEPVLIKRSYDRSMWLNDYSNCGINSFTASGVTVMLAQHFQSPSNNSSLKEISLCKLSGDCILRIRVFDMDSITHQPSTDLVGTVIEVKSNNRHVSLDLQQYKIWLPEKDFFVAIQWLYIPYNEDVSKTNINGERRVITQYAPFLMIKNPKKIKPPVTEDVSEVWQFDHRGRWLQLPGINLMLSVKVSY